MPHQFRIAALCCLMVAVVAVTGCGKKLQTSLGPANRPPEVRLESAIVPKDDAGQIAARLRWTATDPDGRVDHFLVTEDLAALGHETEGWSRTEERERLLSVRRVPLGPAAPAEPRARDFALLAVRAVDDRGAVSLPAYRAFFGENVAPTVRIVSPEPSPLLVAQVAPSVLIRWEGSDPDGHPDRPVLYKFRLFRADSLGSLNAAWLADPDSLRRQFAPAFAGWDSLKGNATEMQFTGLQPNQEYLFVITALDRGGAYDPVFSLSTNMLRMRVLAPGAAAPVISIFSDYFYWTMGGPPPGVITLPGAGPFTFKWFATASAGATITGYRWAVDPPTLDDKQHAKGWSRWDPDTRSATVGPSESDAIHNLFVEARDSNGAHCLAWLQFKVEIPTFARELLIVDDTRFNPDQLAPGRRDSLQAPAGFWPTAAELDTFLYAVGGMRWRMTPSGTESRPGIFHGYRFDTLGTRHGLENPTIPFEVLGRYRHIIWIVDCYSSLFAPGEIGGGPTSPVMPMTTLRYMSSPNRVNTLDWWVRAGGRLWALGGGFGNATMAPWNNRLNDDRGRVYSSLGMIPELRAGRFMYDLAHWRSEFRVFEVTGGRIVRAPSPSARPRTNLPGLPAALAPRSAATDPLPPLRSSANFYNPTYGLEYLTRPNTIGDPKNPSPQHTDDLRALDTLMVAENATLPLPPDPSGAPAIPACMTFYHGLDCGPVVFTGFDIWSWPQADCVRLVDAVLQGVWGLSRTSDAGGAVARARK